MTNTVFELVTGAIDSRDFITFLQAPVVVPPTAHDVEILQCETYRVEARVAGGTGF